ncbi:MAG: hypothetical protein ACFB0C_21100 [Leptolyngbyaceae cyanobacterium]
MAQENSKTESIREYQEYYEDKFLALEFPLQSFFAPEIRYKLEEFSEKIGLSMKDAADAEEFVKQQYSDRISEFKSFAKRKAYENYPLTHRLAEEIKREGLTRFRLTNNDIQQKFDQIQKKQEKDVQTLKLNISSELSKYYLDNQDYGLSSDLIESICSKSAFPVKVTEQILKQIREPVWKYCQRVKEFLLNDLQENSTLNPEHVREILERIRDRYQIDHDSFSYAIDHILTVICKEDQGGKGAFHFSIPSSSSFQIRKKTIVVLCSITLVLGTSTLIFQMVSAYQKSRILITDQNSISKSETLMQESPEPGFLPSEDIPVEYFSFIYDLNLYREAIDQYEASGDFEKVQVLIETIDSSSLIYQYVEQSLNQWEAEYKKNEADLNAIQEDIEQGRLGDAETKISDLGLTILGKPFDEDVHSSFWQEQVESLKREIQNLRDRRLTTPQVSPPSPAPTVPEQQNPQQQQPQRGSNSSPSRDWEVVPQ